MESLKLMFITGLFSLSLMQGACSKEGKNEEQSSSTAPATSDSRPRQAVKSAAPQAATGQEQERQESESQRQSSDNQVFTAVNATGPKIRPTVSLVSGAAAEGESTETGDATSTTGEQDASDDTAGDDLTSTDNSEFSGQDEAEDDWSSGHVLYEIHHLIQEYVDERDNGIIDGSNMYKAMHDAGGAVDMAYENCELLEEEASFESPFDFGDELLPDRYNCLLEAENTWGENIYNVSYAVHAVEGGTQIKALLASTTTEPRQQTRQVVQGSYDTETNRIIVNQAYLVDYEGDQDYAVRLHIDGNTETGLFKLKLSKGPGAGEGSGIAISGHGYARGDKHYLFRVSTTNYAQDVTAAWYCFRSETTLAEMQAMDPAGSATIPAECAEYTDGMPETDYAADGSGAPTGIEVFTGDGPFGTALRR